MIFAKCIELKKLIVRYNRKRSLDEDYIHYEFSMFVDGEWSCTLKCSGCVDIVDFKEVYDFIATFYVSPFMYGSQYGFRVHIQ